MYSDPFSKSSRKTCFGYNSVSAKSTDYEFHPVHFTGDEDGWHHIPDLKYVNPGPIPIRAEIREQICVGMSSSNTIGIVCVCRV